MNACESLRVADGHIVIDIQAVGSGVEIRVIDNGCGIPAAIRSQLFEPFISSGKENGTGLGLTVVQKIIQDHGGDVNVESTSDRGSVFKLVLPLVSPPAVPSNGDGKLAISPLVRARQEQND